MADKILATMGTTLESVKAGIGFQPSSRSTASASTDVIYVPIDMKTIAQIQQLIDSDEPDIATVNLIKDAESLSSGVKLFFAGEELDPEKYPITDAVCELLSELREWYDGPGFVGLYDPNVTQDRVLETIVINESGGVPNNAIVGGNSSATEGPESLLRLADRIVRRAAFDSTAEQFAKRLQLRSLPAPRKVAQATAKQSAYVAQKNPAYSSFKSPGSVLIVGNNRNSRADNGESTRALQVARTSNETRQATYLINKRRTLDETILGVRNWRTVKINEGCFWLEIDRTNNNRRVVFQRNSAATTKPEVYGDAAANQVPGITSQLTYDPDVFVFVWPKRMPRDDGTIRSRMREVLRLRRAMNQAESNLGHVDYRLSHPVQMLTHVAPVNRQDVDRMTDNGLYGGAASVQSRKDQVESIQRDAVMRYQLAVIASVNNQRKKDELSRRIAERRIGDTLLDADGNPTTIELNNDDFFPLPSGITPSAAVLPTTIVDMSLLMFRYRQALFNALGVSQSLVDSGSSFSGRATRGGSGSSSSNVSQGSQALSDKRTQISILTDRSNLRKCFCEFYDLMNREIDNNTLARIVANETSSVREQGETLVAEMDMLRRQLRFIEDTVAIEGTLSEIATRHSKLVALVSRLDRLASQTREIITRRFRLDIQFTNISFAAPEALEAAAMAGAISRFEKAHAIRASFGLSELDEEEFEKFEAEQSEVKEDDLKMESKYAIKQAEAKKRMAAGQGVGGAPPKKKKK
jgi:hypothetical protein